MVIGGWDENYCATRNVWRGAVPTNWTQPSFTGTDLVISVQALNNPDLGWNAKATFCRLSEGSLRPISGVVALNLASILLPDGTPSLN